MRALQVYFDLNKKDFTLDVATSIVKTLVEKYGIRTLIPRHGERAHVTEDIVAGARKLYNDGKGGGFVTFVGVPYADLVIEVHTTNQSDRIPKDKLYLHIGSDTTNFTGALHYSRWDGFMWRLKGQNRLEQFVDDAIRVYYALKPGLGLGGIEDFFEGDGTHFLRELSVYPMMLFSPALVRARGAEKFSALEGKVYAVRTLDDGGIMIRLSRESPMMRGTTELEAFVAKQLGIKS